jgi:hypothetical protein
MDTIISAVVCIGLLVVLAYFAYACAFEIGLAIYRRLPKATQIAIDRLVTGGSRKTA